VTLIVTIVALLIGGIWTVFTFIIGQSPQPALVAEVPAVVTEEPSEQIVDVEILLGHYDGSASFKVDENCQIEGAIDWINRVDNSTIINDPIAGQIDCRSLTINRPEMGDSCTGQLTTIGNKAVCKFPAIEASLKFDPPIKECGC